MSLQRPLITVWRVVVIESFHCRYFLDLQVCLSRTSFIALTLSLPHLPPCGNFINSCGYIEWQKCPNIIPHYTLAFCYFGRSIISLSVALKMYDIEGWLGKYSYERVNSHVRNTYFLNQVYSCMEWRGLINAHSIRSDYHRSNIN